METIDDETSNAAMGFIDKQVKAGTPFFVWMNFTRMHVFTHIRPDFHGKSGMPGNDYADCMWEHDQDVGRMLKQLDDLGVATDHHRNLHDRPRPEYVYTARCSNDAISQRKGFELGGCIPRTRNDSLAPDISRPISGPTKFLLISIGSQP